MHIIKTYWQSQHQAILKHIREQVFIYEQKVPVHIEWDEQDTTAIHLLAQDNTLQAVACARILAQGRIGRMAVLKTHRGQGFGQALMREAIMICQQMGMPEVHLSAQTHAIQLYQQAGFTVVSEPYIDANIWHVDMLRKLI